MKRIWKVGVSLCLAAALFLLGGCAGKYAYVLDMRGEPLTDAYGGEVVFADGEDGGSVQATKRLDAFSGLAVEFDGVSPYCTIAFNTAGCSEDAQMHVQYSLDPQEVTTEGYFAVGDSVTVYAILTDAGGEEGAAYALQKTSQTYTVENVPVYLETLPDDLDLTEFQAQAADSMEALTAFSSTSTLGKWGFGVDINGIIFDPPYYKAHESPTRGEVYFSALKVNARSKYPEEKDCVNRIDITYSINLMSVEDDAFQKRYFTITAKNLIRYPDGTLGWGQTDPAAKDFEWFVDTTSMESLVNTNVVSGKADYNVTTVTQRFA